MPGKSKKGGGLESSPVYKKQGTAKSPFTMKGSPYKQIPKSFNITGSSASTTPGYSTTIAARTQNFRNEAAKHRTVSSKTNIGSKVVDAISKKPAGFIERTIGRAAKTFARGVASTSVGVASLLYDFGKTSVKRKKAGESGFNISKTKTNKGFNFNKK